MLCFYIWLYVISQTFLNIADMSERKNDNNTTSNEDVPKLQQWLGLEDNQIKKALHIMAFLE